MTTATEIAAQISDARHEIRLCSPTQTGHLAVLGLRIETLEAEFDKLEAQPEAEPAQPVAEHPPTARPKGKTVRGTHYASKPRERAEDWYYRKMPEAVLRLVEEGKLNPIDGMYAGIISRHLDTHGRSTSDDSRRITFEALAAKANRKYKSAQASVTRMRKEEVLILVSSGRGNQRGALYSFPGRSA